MNQNINIDMSKVDNITCEQCKNETFVPVFLIKQISALVSPTGKETLIPIQLFKCSECNHINEKFLEGLTN